jgi:hypothetical protein
VYRLTAVRLPYGDVAPSDDIQTGILDKEELMVAPAGSVTLVANGNDNDT